MHWFLTVTAAPPAELPAARRYREARDLNPYGVNYPLYVVSDPFDETWAYLRAAAVKQRFVELAATIHRITPDRAEKAWGAARHFMRQAEDYYRAARQSTEQSSPLLYYYAVLNLCKFMLAIAAPDRVEGRRNLHHGLRVEGDARLPQDAELRSADGIFANIAELLANTAPPALLRVNELLARTMEITAEYLEAKKRRPDMTMASVTARVDPGGSAMWMSVEVFADAAGPHAEAIRWAGSPLDTKFFQVAAAKGLVAFESRDTLPTPDTHENPEEAFRPIARELRLSVGGESPWGRETRRQYAIPFSMNGQAPLPEMVTMYAVLFYLADILRYHPQLFEETTASIDSWVLGSVIRSCPPKFVRLALNFVIGRDIRMIPV